MPNLYGFHRTTAPGATGLGTEIRHRIIPIQFFDSSAFSLHIPPGMLGAAATVSMRTIVDTSHLIKTIDYKYDAQVQGSLCQVGSHVKALIIQVLRATESRI